MVVAVITRSGNREKSASTRQVLVFRPAYQVHQAYLDTIEPTEQDSMEYR